MNNTIHSPVSVRQLLGSLVMSVVLGFPALSSSAEDRPAPDREALRHNAALYYWKAMASMQPLRTPQEIASTAFIRQELHELPPSAFSVRKDAAVWLIGENALIASLRQARTVDICAFPIRQAGSPALNLTHLTPMREMTRYSLEISKAYEFAENPVGAAGIYILLLDMIGKLHQDNNLTSAKGAWIMLQDVLLALEGFVTRDQATEVLDSLLQYFEDNPELPFRVGDYVISESKRYSEWLLEDRSTMLPRLSSLYGSTSDQPGVLRLSSLPPDKQAAKLEGWIQGYQDRMAELASWADQPYLAGLPQLELLDDELEKDIHKDGSEVTNPLLPLLVPYMRSVYEQSLLAKGQYRMMRMALEAARYESLLGSWPKRTETLEAFSSRNAPLDPFSNSKLFFRIRNKAPYMALRVPKWMASEDALVYRLQLAIRENRDNKNFQRLQQRAVKKFIEARKSEPLIQPDVKK